MVVAILHALVVVVLGVVDGVVRAVGVVLFNFHRSVGIVLVVVKTPWYIK